ncbi:hypothetical protein Ddye_001248 [Dipteronia dyeriana]|uniref:RRM domain-containing protein n=1 Tax=Dipteronia dyeriana TaxID=168575 RepID=A0AAD9XN83_9ROSI|nr:hypothetical protein Ddye_001248 [Dipteronia dyeriana]
MGNLPVDSAMVALKLTSLGTCLTFDKQTGLFETRVKNLQPLFGSPKLMADYLSKSLVFISIGNADISTDYDLLDNTTKQRTVFPKFTQAISQKFSDNIKRLYSLGARKFLVNSIGMMGCSPMVFNLEHKATCDDDYNERARIVNKILSDLWPKLQSELPDQSSFLQMHTRRIRSSEARSNFRENLVSIYIDNLNPVEDLKGLWGIFRAFGIVRDIYISPKLKFRRSRYGFIRFATLDEASRVARLTNRMHVYGRPIMSKVTDLNYNERKNQQAKVQLARKNRLAYQGNMGNVRSEVSFAKVVMESSGRSRIHQKAQVEDALSVGQPLCKYREGERLENGRRLAWVEFGCVHLDCWCEDFFRRLGWVVGETLFIEEETLARSTLANGRVLVLIPAGKRCVDSVKVVTSNQNFIVSIKEDPKPIYYKTILRWLGLDWNVDDDNSSHVTRSSKGGLGGGYASKQEDDKMPNKSSEGNSDTKQEDGKVRRKSVNIYDKPNISSGKDTSMIANKAMGVDMVGSDKAIMDIGSRKNIVLLKEVDLGAMVASKEDIGVGCSYS